MKTTKKNRIIFRLPFEDYDKLMKACKKQGKTVSELLRELITKYLKP